MGICESKKKEIQVMHIQYQPIIHENIQPIITIIKLKIIRHIIKPVYVRNEMKAQNLVNQEDILLKNNPQIINAINTISEEEQKEIDEYSKKIKEEDYQDTISEDIRNLHNKVGNQKLNKENEPYLAKVVGNVHHYIKVIEQHTGKNVINPLVRKEIQPVIQKEIQPIIYNY